MSKQCLEPLEVETLGGARSFDLSDDCTFDMVIRMAWTGIIHVHGGSPPCADYSSLRMLPNGPRPVRTPNNMQGYELNTFNRQWDYQNSQLLHKRHVHLCHVVVVMGGFFWEENPTGSLDKLEDFKQAFIIRSGAFLVNVATCADAYNDLPHSERLEKAHCFISNIEGFKELATVCPLHPTGHKKFAGIRDSNGDFISRKQQRSVPN